MATTQRKGVRVVAEEDIIFEIGKTFRLIGLGWGYMFVIVIAGASLIIAYYVKKGKLVVRSPFGLTKNEKKAKEKKDREDSSEK